MWRRLEFRGMACRIPRMRRLEFGRDRERNSHVTRTNLTGMGEESRARWNSNSAYSERKSRIDFGVRGGWNSAGRGRRDRGKRLVVGRRVGGDADRSSEGGNWEDARGESRNWGCGDERRGGEGAWTVRERESGGEIDWMGTGGGRGRGRGG